MMMVMVVVVMMMMMMMIMIIIMMMIAAARCQHKRKTGTRQRNTITLHIPTCAGCVCCMVQYKSVPSCCVTFGHVGTENIQLINSEPADIKGERILSVCSLHQFSLNSK
jgi:hypothetical protein